jgi:hypothetical protein
MIKTKEAMMSGVDVALTRPERKIESNPGLGPAGESGIKGT